jgi:hypothetical protein
MQITAEYCQHGCVKVIVGFKYAHLAGDICLARMLTIHRYLSPPLFITSVHMEPHSSHCCCCCFVLICFALKLASCWTLAPLKCCFVGCS